jgi:hypothetical protein
MKSLSIALTGVGRRSRREDGGGQSNSCKPIQNCRDESPQYNQYILMKIKGKKRKWTNIII